MNWDLATDVVLYASFATLAVFVVMGLAQLTKRRSLTKVDKPLLWMILPLVLMAATYLIFDKFIILNTRPDGSGEPSFPSTHVMVVSTIFLLVAIILPGYIKSKAALICLDLFMLAFIVFVCFGRILANMHWLTDVLGALAFSVVFAVLYYLIIRRYKHA